MAHVGQELGLVLARLRKFAAFLLNLAKEPCVLDCQNRLCAKGLQQIDRVLRKLARLFSSHDQRADDPIGTEQRNSQMSAETSAQNDIEHRGGSIVLYVIN